MRIRSRCQGLSIERVRRVLSGLPEAERYTIEGAKRRLREGPRTERARPEPAALPTLPEVRDELLALYRMLEAAPTPAVPAVRLK